MAWVLLGVLVGFTLENQIDALFRSALSVGIMMMIIGFFFVLPERRSPQKKELNWWRALLIGVAQAFAIIPGVSRSGSTIWTGTLLGMKREDAARFSFLLGSIAIAGAGLLTALDLNEFALGYDKLIAGFLAAFLSGLGAVYALMHFLKQHSLRVFGIYLLFLGFLVLSFRFFLQ